MNAEFVYEKMMDEVGIEKIAAALTVADAIYTLAKAVENLGLAGATDHGERIGAIELLSREVRDGFARLATA